MPLKKKSKVVVGTRVKRIDLDGFSESVLGLLISFSTQEKHSVIIVVFRGTWLETGHNSIVLLGLLELTQTPVQLHQIHVRLN